jgi:hypothetical protein
MRHDALLPVQDAQDDVLAVDGRLRGRRGKSIRATLTLIEVRPSCGARVSAMFMPLTSP